MERTVGSGTGGGRGDPTERARPDRTRQYDVSVRFPATRSKRRGVRKSRRGRVRRTHEEAARVAQDRDRRHVARGVARRGDAASRRLRRHGRRDRRRAASALRPAAAVEGAARRAGRTRRHRAAQAGLSTISSSTGGSGAAPTRLDARRPAGRARRRRARRLRRTDHRDRFRRRAACRCTRTSRACSRCARSTTRSRCAPSSIAVRSVVVIGAGFIGAEVAATCRQRGLDVTILEGLPHPMVRGLGPALGDVIAAVHRDHGVDLRTERAREGHRRRRPRRAPASRRRLDARRRSRRRRRRRRPRDALARKAAGSRSTTASCATRRCSPRPASSPRATSRAGPTSCSTGR